MIRTQRKKVVRITKGKKDPYLKITPLAGYCLQRGWKIMDEYVDLSLEMATPEYQQFLKDVDTGKIKIVSVERELK